MNKYLRITSAIFKYNLVREMEFRANFFLWLGIQGLWVGLQIFIIQVLFQYTNVIRGWTKPEVFFLIGLFRIIKGFFDFFIYENLVYLSESIDRGELDYSLIKPLNTLFLISINRHKYSELGTFLTGIGFVMYGWYILSIPLTFQNILLSVLLMISGLIALYSIILFVSTLSFFLTRLRAISSFYDILDTALRYPTDLLISGRSQMGVILIPLAIVVTVPDQIILGKSNSLVFVGEIAGAMLFFLLAFIFWNFALKHYSSASS